MRHIVVIGATSSIAEHCCRLWAKQEPTLFHLIGRNTEKLQRIQNDILTRAAQSQVEINTVDFLNPSAIENLIQTCAKRAPIDLALIAHGVLPEQEQAEHNLQICQHSLQINALSPALFMEAFAQYFQQQTSGKLAIIGSVAGDRGRKSNYIYGAPKGLITRYAQGLQHRFSGSNIRIILIKPGPVETPMTAHLTAKGGKRANVEKVASDIVRGIDQNRATIYTPSIWSWIMLIVRHLPPFVFNKLNI